MSHKKELVDAVIAMAKANKSLKASFPEEQYRAWLMKKSNSYLFELLQQRLF